MTDRRVMVKTRFLGATDTEGAKLKAWAPTGLVECVAYDHALDPYENHERAALECIRAQGARPVDVVHVQHHSSGVGYAFDVAYTD